MYLNVDLLMYNSLELHTQMGTLILGSFHSLL